jgi:hypothetical protein
MDKGLLGSQAEWLPGSAAFYLQAQLFGADLRLILPRVLTN